jgi:hypothetical protein
MQLQWSSEPCSYLRCGLRQVQNQEQTLELRLTEGMPDIGRVLWTWGQIHLRGKEWRKDSIGVSGGIQVWVLYAPEDGSEPRCIEGWMPFQGKWNLPENHREGHIWVEALLRGLDARTLSARKLMARGSVAILAETMEPAQAQVFLPEELPEGVEIYRCTYPMMLCREAGEKQFSVEDSLPLPEPLPDKILCCRGCPLVTETSVVGSRVVIRGHIRLHCVSMDGDGRLRSFSRELPFAQFADLDTSYDKEASATVTVAVSDLSWEQTGEQMQFQCSLVAQYAIQEMTLLTLAQDAYSPSRGVETIVVTLELPSVLDCCQQTLDAQVELPTQAESVVDVQFWPDHPVQYRENETIVMEVPATFRALYYDGEGLLQQTAGEWSGQWQLPAGDNCSARLSVQCAGESEAVIRNEHLVLTDAVTVQAQTTAEQRFPMVTALEIGDPVRPDPQRPSLILCRAGERSLWELAKQCGSTVDAICRANQLTGEPAADKILLIPVQ